MLSVLERMTVGRRSRESRYDACADRRYATWVVVLVHVDSLALSLFALCPDTCPFVLDSHPPPSPLIAHCMVGTPQLPLKLRRKRADDFLHIDPVTDYTVDEHDMVHHAAYPYRPAPVSTSGTHSNSVSIPHSPGLSFSCGPCSSSPPRSVYTPEPPSSPLSDPFIASSSTASSPRSKHFWDVAFNYGPGFPYKPRASSVIKTKSFQSSPTDSGFIREPSIYSHRRSSSESAPTLMSDMDASEYSEDIDIFSVENSPILHNLDRSKSIKIREGSLSRETELGLDGGIHALEQVDVMGDSKICAPNTGMDVDIDIAAALLDLSRQVRITSTNADRKSAPIAQVHMPVGESSSVRTTHSRNASVAEKMNISIPSDVQDSPTTSSLIIPLEAKKESKRNEEDAYMRSEDGYTLNNTQPNSGIYILDADVPKALSTVDELPIRECIESPGTTCVDEQQSGSEEILTCDRPRSEAPIASPPLPDSDILRFPVASCDAQDSDKVEHDSDIGTSEDVIPSGLTHMEETSHEVVCVRHDLEPHKCEDTAVGLDSTVSTTNPAALDCDIERNVIMGDNDTHSLNAFSISSTLTPISSPLTSPILSAYDSDSCIERLDISEPDSSAVVTDTVKDRTDCTSKDLPKAEEDVKHRRALASCSSRQSPNPGSAPVPGPSSSSSSILKSCILSSLVGEETRIRSRGNALAKEGHPVDDDDDELQRLTKIRGVKPKRSKPTIMDTRGEDKDGKPRASVKVNPKVKTSEDLPPEGCNGERVEKSKPKGERKERKKRPREENEPAYLSRSSTPFSDAAPPKRKKKRSKKADNSTATILEEGSIDGAPSREAAVSSRATSACPSDLSIPVDSLPTSPELESRIDSDPDSDKAAKEELCGLLIQAMALARASSMPASSLIRELLRENPHLAGRRSHDGWLDLINDVLRANVVFGRIDRQGLDAADKPLEPQWYYMPEKDRDIERATLLREMMPKKRNATKKHKQYYYRPVSKITRWDPEDDI